MEFTREPIIETIVSARENHKLLVRSSKQDEKEEFLMDGLQVVSLGKATFFRSLEGSKNFLLPAADYEIVEVPEMQVSLKYTGADQSMTKDSNVRAPKDSSRQTQDKQPANESWSENSGKLALKKRMGKKYNKDKMKEDPKRRMEDQSGQKALDPKSKEGEASSEGLISYPNLLSPPPRLISENLSRYKEEENFNLEKEKVSEPKDDFSGVISYPRLVAEMNSEFGSELPLQFKSEGDQEFGLESQKEIDAKDLLSDISYDQLPSYEPENEERTQGYPFLHFVAEEESSEPSEAKREEHDEQTKSE